MDTIYEIDSDCCNCYGIKKGNGITVLIGSRARKKMVASCKNHHREEQQRIINNQYVEVTSDQLIFIKEYYFNSRALAESVLKGQSRDGSGWVKYGDTLSRYNEEILPYIEEKINKLNNKSYLPEEIDVSEHTFIEGALHKVYINAYERDPKARRACLEHWGYKCKVCNLSFDNQYGSYGKGYIHVHHLVPLSKIGKDYVVNPIQDLCPVCPNCHAMLHKNPQVLQIEELKSIINKAI